MPPAESVRTSTVLPTRYPLTCGGCASAWAVTVMWSAAVLAPALPARNSIAGVHQSRHCRSQRTHTRGENQRATLIGWGRVFFLRMCGRKRRIQVDDQRIVRRPWSGSGIASAVPRPGSGARTTRSDRGQYCRRISSQGGDQS